MAMYSDLDARFHALADGTRRAIVETLQREGELPAGRIVERFNSAQPTISKHLKVLVEAGLVQRRAQGRQQLFSLCPDAFTAVTDWLTRHKRFWNEGFDRLGVYLDDAPA